MFMIVYVIHLKLKCMMPEFKLRTIDKIIYDLCDEVDYWKSEYDELKLRYDALQLEFSQHINTQLESQKETLGMLFRVVLNSEQTEDGILIH
jgi:hypothetical protein